MKKILFLIIILVILGGGYLAYTSWPAASVKNITPVATSTTAAVLTDGTYTFNPTTSNLLWEGKKKFIANYVDRGTIQIKSGEVIITDGQIKSSQIIIDMESITAQSTGGGSGQNKLTEHLKSDDFFNVTTYPEAKFILQSATTDNSDPTKISLNGDLTIRGKTAPLIIPAVISTTDNKITLVGEAIVNRAKYDVKFGSTSFFKDLGDKVIEDDFKLIFTLVAEKK